MATTVTASLRESSLTRIGLGTNRLTNTPETVRFVREAVEAGVQMIDTAHSYTGGQSEEAIGSALSPIPEGCVVATKGAFSAADAEPRALRSQIEESFRRLRTERIGLYYLHRVHPEVPLERSLAVIDEYRVAGRIGYIGISDVTVEQIERACAAVPVDAVQNHYNLSQRQHEGVVDYCAAEGIVFLPYFPLRGAASPDLARIAALHRATPAQITLAWLLKRSPAMLPIPGTLSLEHLRENLDALRIELTDAELRALA
jgi:aryl-alcohol dehydrogenase-like predicted oxidoreductase